MPFPATVDSLWWAIAEYSRFRGTNANAYPNTYADPNANTCSGNGQRGRGQPDATSDHSQWLYGGER